MIKGNFKQINTKTNEMLFNSTRLHLSNVSSSNIRHRLVVVDSYLVEQIYLLFLSFRDLQGKTGRSMQQYRAIEC